jgi:hypothetical protein
MFILVLAERQFRRCNFMKKHETFALFTKKGTQNLSCHEKEKDAKIFLTFFATAFP